MRMTCVLLVLGLYGQAMGQKLTTDVVDSRFGQSVSISGNTALVGAFFDDCTAGFDCGSAYIYRFNGTDWIEEQKLSAPDSEPSDRFGTSVSVDGNTAVIGAAFDDCLAGRNCGSAYVFWFNGTNWVQGQKLVASDAARFVGFGRSVSISGDNIAVGAWGDNCEAGSGCGSVYIYRFDGISWFEEQKLTATDSAEHDFFGNSVSISGNTVLVGAPGNQCISTDGDCGSSYVFWFDGRSWIEKQKLTASDSTEYDNFGFSVSVNGDTALIGAPSNDCSAGIDCGAAYLFRWRGNKWVEVQKLTALDAASSNLFGGSVSVGGKVSLIGAAFGDCPVGRCGSAYVFRRFNPTRWLETQKLIAFDAASGDRFGRSVSVSQDMALVGAPSKVCSEGNSCGAAYVTQLEIATRGRSNRAK